MLGTAWAGQGSSNIRIGTIPYGGKLQRIETFLNTINLLLITTLKLSLGECNLTGKKKVLKWRTFPVDFRIRYRTLRYYILDILPVVFFHTRRMGY